MISTSNQSVPEMAIDWILQNQTQKSHPSRLFLFPLTSCFTETNIPIHVRVLDSSIANGNQELVNTIQKVRCHRKLPSGDVKWP
jgi:hypothetical protein